MASGQWAMGNGEPRADDGRPQLSSADLNPDPNIPSNPNPDPDPDPDPDPNPDPDPDPDPNPDPNPDPDPDPDPNPNPNLLRLGETKGDVLQNFSPGDVVVNCGRFALALVLFFSLPLLVLPCREALLRLFSWRDNHGAVLDTGPAGGASGADPHQASTLHSLQHPLMEGMGGHSPLMEDIRPAHAARRLARRACARASACLVRLAALTSGGAAARGGVAAGVLLSATCSALFVPDIVTVWALLGSSIAVLVAFILPARFYSTCAILTMAMLDCVAYYGDAYHGGAYHCVAYYGDAYRGDANRGDAHCTRHSSTCASARTSRGAARRARRCSCCCSPCRSPCWAHGRPCCRPQCGMATS